MADGAVIPAAIPAEWQSARRVLAIRLDNLGDVLVTSPALHAIKESLPGAELTLLASPVGAQAGRLNSYVDDVIVQEAPWMDPWCRLPQDTDRELAVIERVRAGRFDAAVIFTSFRQSSLPAAYLCYLAGIPLRLAASIDGPGSLLTTRHRHPESMMHEVERGLDLVGAVGLRTGDLNMVLRVPEAARREAAALAAALRGADPHRPLIILHPGCSMPARTYPWEMFAVAADLLVERLGACVCLTGSEEERQLTGRIAARMRHPASDLAGRLSFPVLCGLIEAGDVLLTNNTGPMHIASAVKTPVVALFALTNPPEQWGPWRVPYRQLYHEVPCRLCYSRVCPYGQECLTLVTPDRVAAAVEELLGEASQSALAASLVAVSSADPRSSGVARRDAPEERVCTGDPYQRRSHGPGEALELTAHVRLDGREVRT